MSEKKYDIETEIVLLRQEMKITREEMKKYNDLRKTLNKTIERVVILETQNVEREKKEKEKGGVVKNTRDWILFSIAIAGWLFSFIQLILKL